MCVVFYSCMYVFFFKQKTAYEMRISDWSSDVCSSDLRPAHQGDMVHVGGAVGPLEGARQRRMAVIGVEGKAVLARVAGQRIGLVLEPRRHRGPVVQRRLQGARALRHHRRSEEHTSELQSLMRISYAVFCLKKKKKIIT